MAAGDEVDQVAVNLRRLNTSVSYSAFPRPPTSSKSNSFGSSSHHQYPHLTSSPSVHRLSPQRPNALRAQTTQLPPSPTASYRHDSPTASYRHDSPVSRSPPPRLENLKHFSRFEENEFFIKYQPNDEPTSHPSQQRPLTRPRQLSSPKNSSRPPLTVDNYRPQTSATTATRRRPSTGSSNVSITSPQYPPPTKPLPPLPTNQRNSNRISSTDSFEETSPTSLDILRFSQSTTSDRASISDVASINSIHSSRRHVSAASIPRPLEPEPETRRTSVAQRSLNSSDRASAISSANSVTILPSRLLDGSADKSKKKGNNSAVYYLDLSPNGSTLSSKHGNNIIRFWSIQDGTVHATIKFSSYTDAQSRSRDYLIRSHSILSEGSSLVAIAVKFGRTVEIWNWTAKKCLQSIDNADRWAAGKFEFTENAWSQIAAYHNQGEAIDLFSAARGKKPFAKSRTIELKKAGLPFVPQYPELAISPTSPILVAAAGPRPPRMGSPPPDREVLLVAWEIGDSTSTSHTPWRVNRPSKHPELETAIPSDLVTYGSTVASIWIPASFRTALNRRGDGYNLVSVPVPHKIVLVWDLSENSTRLYRIPNKSTSCVSPDCQYVAYCDVSGGVSARGTLAIMDLSTGTEVWSWPDRDAGEAASGKRRQGYEQLEHLGRVTELSFSVDSKMLVVGDSEGRSGMYELRGGGEGDRMELYAI